jgi:hypothetical protein
VTPKVVPKAACDSKIFLKAGYDMFTGEKLTNDSLGKPEQ